MQLTPKTFTNSTRHIATEVHYTVNSKMVLTACLYSDGNPTGDPLQLESYDRFVVSLVRDEGFLRPEEFGLRQWADRWTVDNSSGSNPMSYEEAQALVGDLAEALSPVMGGLVTVTETETRDPVAGGAPPPRYLHERDDAGRYLQMRIEFAGRSWTVSPDHVLTPGLDLDDANRYQLRCYGAGAAFTPAQMTAAKLPRHTVIQDAAGLPVTVGLSQQKLLSLLKALLGSACKS